MEQAIPVSRSVHRRGHPRGAGESRLSPPKNDRPWPEVQPRDWVFIGKRQGVVAVVCQVEPQRVRVVYLNRSHWAMDEWVVWRGDRWAFEQTGCGFADHDQTLSEHVMRLRLGERD